MAKRATALKPVTPAVPANDFDNDLLSIAMLELEISDKENEMNGKLKAIEGEYAPQVKLLREKHAHLATRVLAIAKQRRADLFGDRKSRKFNFGVTIGFSKADRAVKFLLEENAVIANLKKLGYALGVVKSRESIDKNAIIDTVPEEKREKVGFSVVPTGDEPYLKVDRKTVELLRAAQQQKAS